MVDVRKLNQSIGELEKEIENIKSISELAVRLKYNSQELEDLTNKFELLNDKSMELTDSTRKTVDFLDNSSQRLVENLDQSIKNLSAENLIIRETISQNKDGVLEGLRSTENSLFSSFNEVERDIENMLDLNTKQITELGKEVEEINSKMIKELEKNHKFQILAFILKLIVMALILYKVWN